VPAAIADLYDRMLEKHPDARPQSAREIAESLDAWLKLAGQTSSQQRRGLPERINPGDSGIRATASARNSGIDASRPAGKQGPSPFPSAAPARPAPARPATARPATARPAGRGRPDSGIRFEKAGKQTVTARNPDQTEKPKAAPRAKLGNFLGMPVGFWLMGLGLLVLAGVLAYLVLGKTAGKKGRKTSAPPAVEQAADGTNPDAAAASEQQPAPPKAAAGEPAGEAAPAKTKPAKPAVEKPADKPRPRGPLDDAIEQPAEPAPTDGQPEPPAAPANP
jgi:hypothetical protein